MYIESIELKDFRNYESLLLPLDKGVNILYGDNAQGKTNVLEALYVGCTSKSHRSVKDREMIRFSMEEAHIKLNLRKKDVPYRIDMHIKKNKSKGIALNGVPIRRASQLFGLANLVFFSPEDLSIIKNGPSERRRFMDMELCQLDRLYIHDLIAYNRVLMQRNKLLKELSFREDYRDMLEAPVSLAPAVFSALRKVGAAVMKATGATGFNIMQNNGLSAGQTMFHIHWHIIPRVEGDGLGTWEQGKYPDAAAMQDMAAKVASYLEK